MNGLISQTSDPGLAQAWLMATVGSKPSRRRLLRKNINDLSIPRVCGEVSNIAAEAQNLRITSNLLYGLSLIYKQKVSFMATDLSVVFDRISSPLFTRQLFTNVMSLEERDHTIKSRHAGLRDDARFNITCDFMDESPIVDENRLLDEAFQRSLAIAKQDLEVCGGAGEIQLPAYIAAEAHDRSFLEYINRANLTKEISMEECLTVDFEFNQDGDIVGRNKDDVDKHAGDILLDLNLDEDFNTVSATIEDITKTGNQTSAEQISAMLDQSRAMVTIPQPAPRIVKRRKMTPIYDDVTTMNRPRAEIEGQVNELPRSNSLSQVFYAMSMSQPPFLNMCQRLIYGTQRTSGMSVKMFPSSSRHPDVSNLDSLLKEMDDIERGRDAASRRPSSSLVDSPFDIPLDEIPYNPEEFEIEPLSPMLDEIVEEQSEETSGEYTHTLESFKEFLEEKAAHIAESKQQTVEATTFTFESLIPSIATPTEECIHRNLAANALSCLLQLATAESITIETEPPSERRPSKPDEIYISFV